MKWVVYTQPLLKSMDFRLTKHTQDMLKERNILEEWIWRTLNHPDGQTVGSDNNIHYFKSINEHEGRILHAVGNPHVSPKTVVTVFFNRRAKGKI